MVLSQGLADEWSRHSLVEEAGCRASTLCHSSGPATGLKGRVGDPERSQAGVTNPDTYRARPTCKQAEAHELVSKLAFL